MKPAALIRDTLRPEFYHSVANVLHNARSNAYRAVNFAMVEAYWNIGQMIVEEEQQGNERAEYGAFVIRNLSNQLTEEFGKGFAEQSLRNMRQFFLCFEIRSAVRSELSWTHYKMLIRIENETGRTWYMTEAADRNWSTRTLERQINSLYYERLLMSRDKTLVIEEMQEKAAPLAATPRDFIKDPYILEFLGLKDNTGFREAEQPLSASYRRSCWNWGKDLPLSPGSRGLAPRPRIFMWIWSFTTISSNVSSLSI